MLLKPTVPWLIQTVFYLQCFRRLSLCCSLRRKLPFFETLCAYLPALCFRLSRFSVTRAVTLTCCALRLLRDVPCAGILQCESSQVRDKTQIFRLFCHECQRVFHDRLINNQDKNYFNAIVCEMAGESKFPPSSFLTSPIPQTSLTDSSYRPLLLHRPGAVVLCVAAHHIWRLHQGQMSLSHIICTTAEIRPA